MAATQERDHVVAACNQVFVEDDWLESITPVLLLWGLIRLGKKQNARPLVVYLDLLLLS